MPVKTYTPPPTNTVKPKALMTDKEIWEQNQKTRAMPGFAAANANAMANMFPSSGKGLTDEAYTRLQGMSAAGQAGDMQPPVNLDANGRPIAPGGGAVAPNQYGPGGTQSNLIASTMATDIPAAGQSQDMQLPMQGGSYLGGGPGPTDVKSQSLMDNINSGAPSSNYVETAISNPQKTTGKAAPTQNAFTGTLSSATPQDMQAAATAQLAGQANDMQPPANFDMNGRPIAPGGGAGQASGVRVPPPYTPPSENIVRSGMDGFRPSPPNAAGQTSPTWSPATTGYGVSSAGNLYGPGGSQSDLISRTMSTDPRADTSSAGNAPAGVTGDATGVTGDITGLTGDITGISGNVQTPAGDTTQPTTTSGLIDQFSQAGDDANAANEQRYQQGMGMYQQIADMYAPGGGWGAGQQAAINQAKFFDMAGANQAMVSSGMSNTTRPATIGASWEREVGTPWRLQAADIQAQRYGEAVGNQAGFLERRTDQAPDPNLMAGLVTGAESGPGGADYSATSGGGTGGTGGTSGSGSSSGGFGSDVDITDAYFESGTFSPDATIRAFAGKQPAEQENMLKLANSKYTTATKSIENIQKQIDTKNEQLAALPEDSTKRASLQKAIANLEKKLTTATDKAAKFKDSFDGMLQSRQLQAAALGGTGVASVYAQQLNDKIAADRQRRIDAAAEEAATQKQKDLLSFANPSLAFTRGVWSRKPGVRG